MKKWFLLVLCVGLFVNFALASDRPHIGIFGVEDGNDKTAADAEKLQNDIEKYSPLDESGKIDYGKYKPFVTKAEMRIATINAWLDANIGWMRYIFHMKPTVSWLFFINIFIILWFFTILFLNGKELWFFIEKEGGRMIFGFGVFFILLVVRLYYGMAIVVYNFLAYIFTTLAESALWIGIIFIGICIFGGWFGFSVIGSVFAWWAKYRETKERIRLAADMKSSSEAVNSLIDEIGK